MGQNKETRLVIRRKNSSNTMEDMRDADYNLERLKSKGEIPENVEAETIFRQAGVVITVRSPDADAAQAVADKIAKDPKGLSRFFITYDHSESDR